MNLAEQHPAYSRRHVLRLVGASAAVAAFPACGVLSPTVNPNEPFDLGKFDRWYRYAKLYNGPNPNLRSPHRPTPYSHGLWAATFREALEKQVTPGVTYQVPPNEVMVAMAPGIVQEQGEITGTVRGWF
jgi:hypothetical protein